MVEPERHASVHVLGRPDALTDRERSLIHELARDAPEHEAGRIADPFGHEPARLEEIGNRIVTFAGQLDQRSERRHEVEADARPLPESPIRAEHHIPVVALAVDDQWPVVADALAQRLRDRRVTHDPRTRLAGTWLRVLHLARVLVPAAPRLAAEPARRH